MTDKAKSKSGSGQNLQLTTFKVHQRLYGIDVREVQEIVKPMSITPVPHAPAYVLGLINLRGQIATAVGISELFGLALNERSEMLNIICHLGQSLIALQVDEIGDVVDVRGEDFEGPPSVLPEKIRSLLYGIYKTKEGLLSVIDLKKLAEALNIKNNTVA